MPAHAGISESRTSEGYGQCGDSGIRRNDKREVLPTLPTRLTLSTLLTLKTIIQDPGKDLFFLLTSLESRVSAFHPASIQGAEQCLDGEEGGAALSFQGGF